MVPTPRLLLCNDRPTEEEREAIVRSIATLRAALSQPSHQSLQSIHGQVKSHKNRSAQTQWNHVAEALKVHYNLIFGVRNLPDEVLENIFRLVLISLSSHPTALSWHTQLDYLIRTCRTWRNIATTSPRLWSVLPHFTLPLFTRDQRDLRRLEVAKLYLERSGDYCLEISVNAHSFSFRDSGHADLLSLLTSHSHRWKRATFRATSSTLAYICSLLPPHSHNLAQLETLSLSLCAHSEMDDSCRVDLFSRCRSLRRLHLSREDKRTDLQGNTWEKSPFKHNPPWSRLEEFEDIHSTGPDSKVVKTKCYNGEDTIHWMLFKCSIPLLTSVIAEHPNITRLDLSVPTISPFSPLVRMDASFGQKFFLPQLKELSVDNPLPVGLPRSLTFVEGIITVSRCSLEKLSIQGFPTEPGVLIRILAMSENLKELRIDPIPKQDLCAMIVEPSGAGGPSALVPSLEILEVRQPSSPYSTFPSMDAASLISMARSRADRPRAGDDLKVVRTSIRLSFHPPGGVTCKETFEYLQDEGLGVSTFDENRGEQRQRVKQWKHVLQERLLSTEDSKTFRLHKPAHPVDSKKTETVLRDMELYDIEKADFVLLQVSIFPTECVHRAHKPCCRQRVLPAS